MTVVLEEDGLDSANVTRLAPGSGRGGMDM